MTQRVHFWKGKWDQQTLSQINKWKDKKTPNKKKSEIKKMFQWIPVKSRKWLGHIFKNYISLS